MKKVSIIMSVYNEIETEVELSINSILNQTYLNLEIIIVIDNPNNEALIKKIKKYSEKDNRIKCIYNDKNIGLANSLNKGLKISTGDYIARMDADDISYPLRIEKQVEYLEKNKDIFLLGCQAEKIDDKNIKIGNIKYVCDYSIIKILMKYRSCFLHPAIIFRREVLLETGGYRNFPCAQDYDFFSRIIDLGYRGENLSETLIKYRVRENSISSEKRLLQMILSSYIQLLSRERKENGKDSFSDEKIKELEKTFLANKDKFDRLNKIVIKIKKQKGLMYCFIPYIYIASKYYRREINNKIKIFIIEKIIKIKRWYS